MTKQSLWGKVLGIIGLSFIVFLVGFMASELVNSQTYAPVAEEATSVMPTRERISPADHISEDKIHVYKDHIYIDLKDASWGTFLDTNSMDPLLDQGHNSIEIKPESFEDINEGDIIVYSTEDYGYIIHRVTATGFDNEGWYAFAKGDNNTEQDPWKIRFNQIEGIVVGIIY